MIESICISFALFGEQRKRDATAGRRALKSPAKEGSDGELEPAQDSVPAALAAGPCAGVALPEARAHTRGRDLRVPLQFRQKPRAVVGVERRFPAPSEELGVREGWLNRCRAGVERARLLRTWHERCVERVARTIRSKVVRHDRGGGVGAHDHDADVPVVARLGARPVCVVVHGVAGEYVAAPDALRQLCGAEHHVPRLARAVGGRGGTGEPLRHRHDGGDVPDADAGSLGQGRPRRREARPGHFHHELLPEVTVEVEGRLRPCRPCEQGYGQHDEADPGFQGRVDLLRRSHRALFSQHETRVPMY